MMCSPQDKKLKGKGIAGVARFLPLISGVSVCFSVKLLTVTLQALCFVVAPSGNEKVMQKLTTNQNTAIRLHKDCLIALKYAAGEHSLVVSSPGPQIQVSSQGKRQSAAAHAFLVLPG